MLSILTSFYSSMYNQSCDNGYEAWRLFFCFVMAISSVIIHFSHFVCVFVNPIHYKFKVDFVLLKPTSLWTHGVLFLYFVIMIQEFCRANLYSFKRIDIVPDLNIHTNRHIQHKLFVCKINIIVAFFEESTLTITPFSFRFLLSHFNSQNWS